MKHVFPIAVAAVALVACGDSRAPVDSTSSLPPLPEHYVAAAPLPGAQHVKEVRETAAEGQRVTLKGTLQDFGALATFRLVDDSLNHCGELGDDDHCSTPWDFCCEDPDALRRYTVNVEFLDGEVPGPWRLRGAHGLDRLKEVTVAGVLHVDERGNLRLAADRIALQ